MKDEKPTGYLSNVFTAVIHHGPDQEKLELFIKAAHEDQERSSFVSENGMDVLELTFYQNILPLLTKFETSQTRQEESDLLRCFPRFYAGHCEDGDFYLILENVCSRHFRLAHCNSGLDQHTAELMLEKVN